MKETCPKVGRFAGFYHHHLETISAHTHAHYYPLFESEIKTGL